MNKEKNLTFRLDGRTTEKVAANADRHTITQYGVKSGLVENISFIPSNNTEVYLSGPVVDRLHDFEELGMEPEKIGALKGHVDNLMDLIMDKNEEIMNKDDQIAELADENYELRQQVKFLEESIDSFSIDDAKKEIERLTNMNDRLIMKNERLLNKLILMQIQISTALMQEDTENEC